SGSVTPTEPTTAPTEPTTAPTQPTTAPTEPTTAPTEPTTAPTEPVGGEGVVVADSLKVGDKIVFVAEYNGKYYAMTNDASINNALGAEEVTVNGDSVDVAVTRSAGSEAVWTLASGSAAGTFLLRSSDGKYINWTTGTTLKLADSGANLTLTCGKGTSSAVVTATASEATVRALIFRDNGGQLQFRAYSQSNATSSGYSAVLTIYKLSGSVTPTQPTTAPTEPTTAPTEPTTAPTEPTTAPTEPTTAPSGNEYVLTTSLKDGDQVIIYNASAGKAMSEDAVSTNYRAGADVTVSGNKIVTDDSKIVWTVKASGSGFTFANDNGETLSATKGLSFATTDNVWAVNPATTANSVYLVSTTATGSSGDAKYIEWYDKYSEFSTYYYSANSEAIFAMQLFALSGSVAPTEPTTAPTEPTTAPTEPTTTPTEPTTAPADLPFANGDCVVIYNAAGGLIIGYSEDNDADESTGEFTYWNITTESAEVSGSTLKASFENAGTFYATINEDGTVMFLDQYDYDQSEDPENPDMYFITAEAPHTYYDNSTEYASFEVIAVDGGYLLKNVGDSSYYAIENGKVFAKDLVEGDPSFIFQFAIWTGETEGENTIVCTLPGGSVTPTQPTTAPTEPTTAPTQPTTAPTEPTTAPTEPTTAPTEPAGENVFVLTNELKDSDEVIIYNPGHGKAIKNENEKDWYLVAEAITPADGKITDPDDSLVWTYYDNFDGTCTFANGDNMIVMWVSGNYFEVTNDPTHEGADGSFVVTFNDGLAYIKHATFSNNYGSAYLECFAKSGVDKICGYSSQNPTANDFGFEFYVKGEGGTTPTEPTTAPTEPTTAPTEPTTAPTEPTTAPTEPTTAPTEPTTAPTEPTTAPTEPTEPVGEETGYFVADSLKAGDKIVLVAEYNNAFYAMANDTSINNALGAAQVTISGKQAIVGNADVVWEVAAGSAAGTYVLKNKDGKCINWTSSTSLKLADAGVDFNATCGEGTSSLLVASTVSTATVRGLIFRDNGGALQFRAYSTSNATQSGYSAVLTIYKYTTGSTTPTEPTTAPTEPTTAPTEPTTAPTEPTTAPTEPTTPPSGDQYVVADSVKVGDKIVLVAEYNNKYYAMANDTSINNALGAAEVTVANGAVNLGSADAVWEVVAGSAAGTFLLKNSAGKYIHWTSSTSLKLADSGVDFQITCGNGTAAILIASTVGTATVRSLLFRDNGGTLQFRAYSTTNATTSGYSGVLTIYKLG
ncbi:MAG: hypothetical protein IJJ99_06275, partial [Oscillospiraceae bacterium]|nr:hypothetical protein [Oscillospiraceae bacterium]